MKIKATFYDVSYLWKIIAKSIKINFSYMGKEEISLVWIVNYLQLYLVNHRPTTIIKVKFLETLRMHQFVNLNITDGS